MQTKLTPTFSLLALAILLWSSAAGLSGYLAAPKSSPGQSAAGSAGSSHMAAASAADLSPELRALKSAADASTNEIEPKLRYAKAVEQEAIQKTDNALLMEAVQEYSQVLNLQAEQPDALLGMATLCFEAGIIDKAQEYYQRYLKQKPDDLRAKTDFALTLIQGDALDQALGVLGEVTKADPKLFQAQLAVALVYKLQGKTDAAKKQAEEAKKLAPSDAERTHIDGFLAALNGPQDAPAAVPAAGMPPASAASAAEEETADEISPARRVADYFNTHPILGPKLQGITWPELNKAQVRLRNFPVEQMPPFAKQKFISGMQERLAVLPQAVTVELVDAESGKSLMSIEVGKKAK
jgi:tetratricopeptide (TPR) repeat protein